MVCRNSKRHFLGGAFNMRFVPSSHMTWTSCNHEAAAAFPFFALSSLSTIVHISFSFIQHISILDQGTQRLTTALYSLLDSTQKNSPLLAPIFRLTSVKHTTHISKTYNPHFYHFLHSSFSRHTQHHGQGDPHFQTGDKENVGHSSLWRRILWQRKQILPNLATLKQRSSIKLWYGRDRALQYLAIKKDQGLKVNHWRPLHRLLFVCG